MRYQKKNFPAIQLRSVDVMQNPTLQLYQGYAIFSWVLSQVQIHYLLHRYTSPKILLSYNFLPPYKWAHQDLLPLQRIFHVLLATCRMTWTNASASNPTCFTHVESWSRLPTPPSTCQFWQGGLTPMSMYRYRHRKWHWTTRPNHIKEKW